MPIIHEVEQRSEAWDRLRLGIPTASLFFRIYTPGGKPSEQWQLYAYHLIAERLLQRPVDSYTSPEMERGVDEEPEAASWYELINDVETQKIGFITTDDGKIGASPDRLVGDDGVLEIKCPKPATQIQYVCTGKLARRYWPQLQGQLLVSERVWVDVVAWTKDYPIPSQVIRVERDEKYIAGLAKELARFNDEIERVMGMIRIVAPRADEPTTMLKAALRASLEIVP